MMDGTADTNPSTWSQRHEFASMVSSGGHASVGGPDGVGLAEQLLTVPHRIAFSPSRLDFLEAAAAELRDLLASDVTVQWLESGTVEDPTDGKQVVLSITEQKQPLARLSLQRGEPFTAEERRLLRHLAQSLSYLLTVKATAVETRLLAELSSVLPASFTLEDAARDAVEAFVRHLEAQSATLLKNSSTGFRTLATAGEWPDHVDALGVAQAELGSPGTAMCTDGVLTCPIGGDGKVRYMLLLKFPRSEPGVRAKVPSVQQAAQVLSPHLEARWRTFVLGELLKLNEESADTPTQVMYDRMLETAVRLVPGADSGSLTTRTNSQEPFSYQAVRGFDSGNLLGMLTTTEEAKAWYGPDTDGWLHGRPREIRADETDITAYGRATTPQLDILVASYDDIKSSLCLPVLHDGEVLAMLNVENQSDAAALGRDAMEVLQLFGAPLASLLHRQQLRDVLTHAALNDDLTGRANRRAFGESGNRAIARHKRSGRPLSMLSMDLKGFKQVNDTLGHDAGDDALRKVSRTLEANLRDGDLLCRIGGDEFAVLLSDTPAHEAEITASRLRDAIAALEFRGMQIRINIGVSTAPEDGDNLQELSVVADRRMYLDKWGRG